MDFENIDLVETDQRPTPSLGELRESSRGTFSERHAG